MIIKMFTVYDSKTEAYLPPFYQPTNGAAIRLFEDSANDLNHAFYKHPSDYTLFYLGTFDDQKAIVECPTAMTSLGLAIEYRKQREIPFGDPELPHLAEVKS